MKKLLILINCLLFLLPFNVIGFAADSEEPKINTKNGYYDIDSPEYETDIALLVNADTDTVIYGKNQDKVTAPASLTKIVTALVVLSECSDLDKKITCSYDAIHSLDGTGSSVAGLMADEVVPLEMLLYCLFLPSANDAAAVLAEEFGGGDTAVFVEKMNNLVKELGCKNTFFANPHGLDDESVKGYNGTTQNQTTAWDMYLISKEALKNDIIVKISSKYGKTMPETNKSDIRYLYNTNALLNSYSEYYYENAIGLKTGTTDKAGACLISSATKDGYTYISIAMGGTTEYSMNGKLYNSAFLMCRYMLRWAFNNIKMIVFADTSYICGEVAVKYGRGADYVGLVPKQTVSSVAYKELVVEDLEVVLPDSFPTEVDSPIEKGDTVGTAEFMYNGVKIADVELVAYQTIKRNHLWAMFSRMEKIVTSKVFWVIAAALIIIAVILTLGTKNKRREKARKKSQINVVKDYSKLSK
ncbi:MAG: D-alanyl-D-alanine carboxypeptidase family protein [Acutalibacteraceae bacterium]